MFRGVDNNISKGLRKELSTQQALNKCSSLLSLEHGKVVLHTDRAVEENCEQYKWFSCVCNTILDILQEPPHLVLSIPS